MNARNDNIDDFDYFHIFCFNSFVNVPLCTPHFVVEIGVMHLCLRSMWRAIRP